MSLAMIIINSVLAVLVISGILLLLGWGIVSDREHRAKRARRVHRAPAPRARRATAMRDQMA